MATHSSILAWRIPWTEEPGGLQSMGLQRVRHDCTCMHGIYESLCYTPETDTYCKSTILQNKSINIKGKREDGATGTAGWAVRTPEPRAGLSLPPEPLFRQHLSVAQAVWGSPVADPK